MLESLCPYTPVHSEYSAKKYLSENFYKKPYDRFMWWRGYSLRTEPLPARAKLIDKIKNGDFEPGPYHYEISLVEHKLKIAWLELYPDHNKFMETQAINIERRKRLFQEYEKDEKKKFEKLYKFFNKDYNLTQSQIDDDLINLEIDNLEDYWEYCEKTYKS